MKSMRTTLTAVAVMALSALVAPVAEADVPTVSNLERLENANGPGDLDPKDRAEFDRYVERERTLDPADDNIYDTSPFSLSPEGDNGAGGQAKTDNPVATADDRLGKLYINVTGLPYSPTSWTMCTANYLGNRFWLTAQHCVDGLENNTGAIRQADGEVAGIERIFTIDRKTDIALARR
ncbi:hypothetical protein QP948_07965 [Corynebacterium bovis]|uniref:hypothetical protein n=1 Tax=Corynebacterium bovis TaxID=36808 RepID=UPI00254CE7EA|nr:hypothetical protein [Corynebacterium bovis]MDK8511327.1 hypothetical protein [Corynebacterium bovis]